MKPRTISFPALPHRSERFVTEITLRRFNAEEKRKKEKVAERWFKLFPPHGVDRNSR